MKIKNIKNILLQIVTSPKNGWDIIKSEEFSVSDLILLFFVLLFIASVSLFFGLLLSLGLKLGISFIFVKVVFFVITYTIWFFLTIFTMRYIFLFYNKNNKFIDIVKLISFSSVILLFVSIITNLFIDSSHLFITFLSEVYSVYIFVTGVSVIYKLTDNQRFLVSASYAVLLVLIFILIKTFQYFI